MAVPTFRYEDVSRDPNAEVQCATRPETRAMAATLGFERLGFVSARLVADAAVTPVQYMTEVWRSGDGTMLLSASLYRGREDLGVSTLFEDGTIISTEQVAPGLMGLLAAHGIPSPPSAGRDWKPFWGNDPRALVEAHRSRVEHARRTTGSSIFSADSMDVYFAIRLRGRELADRSYAVRDRLGRAGFVVGVVLALLGIGWSVARALRSGEWAMVALSTMLGLWGPLLAGAAGFLVVGPVLARRRPERRVPVEELLERAKTVGFGEAPPPTQPVFLPDAPDLPADRARALEKRDVGIFALEAALPILAVGLLAALSPWGALIGFGLDSMLRGGLALRFRQQRLAVFRRWWVRELVDSEPIDVSAACPLVSPKFAGLQLVLGVGFVAYGAHRWATQPAMPLAFSFVAILLLGSAFVGVGAARRAARRHVERRQALAAKARAR